MSVMAVEIYNRIDVTQLECHFKWFNELNKKLNGKWRTELLTTKHLHNDLKKKLNSSDDAGAKVDPDSTNDHVDEQYDFYDEPAENGFTIIRSRLSQISWSYTLIVRNVFEKNFSDAFEMSKKLLSSEEATNPSQPQAHIDTFAYIGLSNQLNIIKEWRSGSETTSVNDDEMVEVIEKIESLRSSAESNEGKAFINAMKSNLARDMMDQQLRIDFAKKATEINPNWADWQVMLYYALRKHRRSTDFRQKPSQMEIDACEKSFQLKMNEGTVNVLLSSVIAMSKMYSELLFTCCWGSAEHQEITERAIKFAREAVRLKPHSDNIKIRLASLLSSKRIYKRYQTDGYEEALALYKECEAGSYSSEVCHKLGKFYDDRKNPKFNSDEALKWFEKGLEAHIGNFPCFVDMVRNSVFQRKSTAKIVDKIDQLMSFQSQRNFKCQLMFIKGFFLWTNDPEASLHWWLMAMEEAADLSVNFVSLATFNFCYIRDGNKIQASRMMYHVKFFMKRHEAAHSEDDRFMKLEDIVKSIIEHFSPPNNFPFY